MLVGARVSRRSRRPRRHHTAAREPRFPGPPRRGLISATMRHVIPMLALIALGACAAPRTQIARRDLFLPEGDVESGKKAFVELGCTSCHQVAGAEDLPAPSTDEAPPIVLGGAVRSRPTDAAMVTSIIHPNQRISRPYQEGTKTHTGSSRMGDFNEAMTVRQMIDLIAFIRAHYTYE